MLSSGFSLLGREKMKVVIVDSLQVKPRHLGLQVWCEKEDVACSSLLGRNLSKIRHVICCNSIMRNNSLLVHRI